MFRLYLLFYYLLNIFLRDIGFNEFLIDICSLLTTCFLLDPCIFVLLDMLIVFDLFYLNQILNHFGLNANLYGQLLIALLTWIRPPSTHTSYLIIQHQYNKSTLDLTIHLQTGNQLISFQILPYFEVRVIEALFTRAQYYLILEDAELSIEVQYDHVAWWFDDVFGHRFGIFFSVGEHMPVFIFHQLDLLCWRYGIGRDGTTRPTDTIVGGIFIHNPL